MQVQITAPIHGAILNRHDGRQDDTGLHITVQGVVSEADTVTVNGVTATIIGATFTADYTLDAHETVLTAVAERGGEDANPCCNGALGPAFVPALPLLAG